MAKSGDFKKKDKAKEKMLTEPIVEDVENDQVNFRDDSIKTEDPEVAS